ncbi:hypothetical protein EVAR_67801_1 [Eumeta japonica]|uniref:Uncharacterized protein n=1 Tax=Eumeta variegata TaxID=151549 RepID=A0A4C2A5M3_EUMVA|nr:hypothetical protein EVAR_67801_1 [Eumeta japonica]
MHASNASKNHISRGCASISLHISQIGSRSVKQCFIFTFKSAEREFFRGRSILPVHRRLDSLLGAIEGLNERRSPTVVLRAGSTNKGRRKRDRKVKQRRNEAE